MSQITKIILRVITERIRNKIGNEIAEEQYGFMLGGARNAISTSRVLTERVMEMQKDHHSFIDYEKALNRVKQGNLAEILRNINTV